MHEAHIKTQCIWIFMRDVLLIHSILQVAARCYHLHNFNSLKAVLAGLQCTPVFRLKRSWKEVPAKKRKYVNLN